MTIAQECMHAANVHLTLGIILAAVAIAVGILFDVLAYQYCWNFFIPASVWGLMAAFLIGGVVTGNLEACKENAAAHTKEYSYSTHEEAQEKFDELLGVESAEARHLIEYVDSYYSLSSASADDSLPTITTVSDKITVETCSNGHFLVTYTEYRPTETAEKRRTTYQDKIDVESALR